MKKTIEYNIKAEIEVEESTDSKFIYISTECKDETAPMISRSCATFRRMGECGKEVFGEGGVIIATDEIESVYYKAREEIFNILRREVNDVVSNIDKEVGQL